jgi:shikimate kinase
VLKLSAEASIASGASVTGAFDDAASCLLGGINHANNLQRRLINSLGFEKPVSMVIFVPRKRSRRASVSVDFVRRFSKLADEAFRISMKGDHWGAMTLNGLLYSAIYGYDPSPALGAIRRGASGAGLSGTGPAIASVFTQDRGSSAKTLIRAWRALGGSVIFTQSNNERARIVEHD